MKLLKMKKLFCIFLVFNLITWGLYFIFDYYDFNDATVILMIVNPVPSLSDIHIDDGVSSLIIFKSIIFILLETLYLSAVGFLLTFKDFYLCFVAFIISLPYTLCVLLITCVNILGFFGLYRK